MPQVPGWMKASWSPLKQKTRYTIIAAVVVVVIMIIVITLSKLNEQNRNAVSLPMKNRIKDVVKTADAYIKSAAKNIGEARAYHDLTKAMAYLEAAKQLVGVQSLPRISGYNISIMDKEADAVYNTLVQNGRIKPIDKQPLFDATVVSNTPNVSTNSESRPSIKERIAMQKRKFKSQ